jgi:hypothetical protein
MTIIKRDKKSVEIKIPVKKLLCIESQKNTLKNFAVTSGCETFGWWF